MFISEILTRRKPELEDFNTFQLQDGMRIDGTILPDYSPISVAAGKPAGPIRLFDEGDFYEGITVFVGRSDFHFEGLDEKTEMLEERHGEVVGLTEENIDRIPDEFLRVELLDATRRFVLS